MVMFQLIKSQLHPFSSHNSGSTTAPAEELGDTCKHTFTLKTNECLKAH